MGVTIHFEGKLKSELDYQQLISKAIEFAIYNDSEYLLINEPCKLLERVKDEKNWDYEGPTKGIQIHLSPNIDPLILEFDQDLYIQEYCKTQFANTGIHIEIINFLRGIENHFQRLLVNDEGEYWETKDEKLLQEQLDNCNKEIEKLKREDPELDGPFRMRGRIIDLVKNA